MRQTYTGGCQCGKVKYEVEADIGEVIACNCSRCGKLGSLLAFAPRSAFTLKSGEDETTEFNGAAHAAGLTHVARRSRHRRAGETTHHPRRRSSAPNPVRRCDRRGSSRRGVRLQLSG